MAAISVSDVTEQVQTRQRLESVQQEQAALLNELGEAVLAGQVGRALRMLEGLQAEGEAAVLVHWTLAEDVRALKRAKDSLGAGRALPIALREARVWGAKERLFERALPLFTERALTELLQAAQVCDGLVKGLKHPQWPLEPWEALKRLVLLMLESTTTAGAAERGRPVRLASVQ